MKKTLIDELIDAYLNSKDPDPECSEPAYSYFKTLKKDIEEKLEKLEELEKKYES